MTADAEVEIAIIGGGIAGASLAWRLAARHRVAILERERQPGYHASGRSATYFRPALGLAPVRALTAASESFFVSPPAGFATVPLLRPLPALTVARADARAALEAEFQALRSEAPGVEWLEAEAIRAQVPILRTGGEAIRCGLLDPRGGRIDGAALLQGYLAGARAQGALLWLDAEVAAIERDGADWELAVGTRRLRARLLVDAAGAWGDRIAALAHVPRCGLQALRRTVLVLERPAGVDPRGWPHVRAQEQDFYFTAETTGILLSPVDETPLEPQDVQPEELDVALAIDRFETVTTLRVGRILAKWAGLRTFCADRVPAVGFDRQVRGFFWCVGQGGAGLQTSPALSALAAALIEGRALPASLEDAGVAADDFDPDRGRRPAPE